MPTTSPTILHILSQRPGRTGSGVTLEALVRGCASSGYDQHVIVGTDTSDPSPKVGDLPATHIHPLIFNTSTLDFPLPGMSDVMPYKSTVFSTMTNDQLETYRTAWKNHIQNVIEQMPTKPTLIHSHHIWIMSSLLKDIAPDIPVITHCHSTGLRQMEFCPHLAEEVSLGISRNDHFVVLHTGHEEELKEKLNLPDKSKITVVGAGFDHQVFLAKGRTKDNDNTTINLLYAGKYAPAKGLPWLLDAVERLTSKTQNDKRIHLFVAGTGTGELAEQLRHRMESMPNVTLLGQVDQVTLANRMRQSDIFILPSFFEGLPLVLVEAAACGCRLIATNLPGVQQQLAEPLKVTMELVELPRLQTVDKPVPEDLPAFVDRLVAALESAIEKPPIDADEVASRVAPFTWTAVYKRIEKVWLNVLEGKN